jgi:hypothetical protein
MSPFVLGRNKQKDSSEITATVFSGTPGDVVADSTEKERSSNMETARIVRVDLIMMDVISLFTERRNYGREDCGCMMRKKASEFGVDQALYTWHKCCDE